MKKLIVAALLTISALAVHAEIQTLHTDGADIECNLSYDNAQSSTHFYLNSDACAAALAKSHSPQSALNLGEYYQSIGLNDKAIQVFLSTKIKARIVSFYIAQAYDSGEGLPRNYVKAAEFYNYSWILPMSMNNLGLLFKFGRGVKTNIEEAYALFDACASHPYVEYRQKIICKSNMESTERILNSSQVDRAQARATFLLAESLK